MIPFDVPSFLLCSMISLRTASRSVLSGFANTQATVSLSIRGLAPTYHAPQVDLASPQKVVLVELMRVSDT
jgi:hypothetical protein